MEYLDPDPVVIRIEIDMNALLADAHRKPEEARKVLDHALRYLSDTFQANANLGWWHRPKKIIDKLNMHVDGKWVQYARVFAIPRHESGFRNIRKS